MKNLEIAADRIRNSRTIAIAGHINPDGDSIGSLLGLGLALKKLGKRVQMISGDGIPRRYRLLPGANNIMRKISGRIDLAISVDCSNKEILGRTYDSFKAAGSILEIDHHVYRRSFGDLLLIDEKAAAVGEVIFVLLRSLDIAITKDVAQNLLTSIIVETGSFRLPNVRPFTFEVCTELIKKGINFYKLVEMVFWSQRKEAAVLSGFCMSQCKFLMGGRLAWSIVRKEDLEAVNGRPDDIDAVPDEMRSIKTVKIAVLFREVSREFLRVSLRSKESINVAALAEKHNGGGHFDVAGCNIPNNSAAIRRFLKEAKKLL